MFLTRINIIFATLIVSGLASEPHLKILPEGPQTKRSSMNLVLTCKVQVPNSELVKDIKWLDPEGQEISQDSRMYTEVNREEVAVSLYIKRLSDEDAGEYLCTALYAGNLKMSASVSVSVFLGITWVDAPLEQFAKIDSDFKLRCKVQANPAANIDWLKESVIISSVDGHKERSVKMIKDIPNFGDRYVIEPDGLIIKSVRKGDGGTYTCRARVPHTGELEERDISLEVQEPPSWVIKPADVEGVESEKVEFQCQALAFPLPTYSWVDAEGISITEREGTKVDENTGTMTLFNVERKDAGDYTCIAENNAGRLEAAAHLSVIIKPKVQQLENVTSWVGKEVTGLTCLASGDPLPKIIWRKWSRNEAFSLGQQKDDVRITVTEEMVAAPDYTEGEVTWQRSRLVIEHVNRSDDGLYECQAVNVGGKFVKSGHISVEFAPTFEEQVITEEWSWDQRATNLSCLATSNPNSTITWWYRELEVGREDHNLGYVSDHDKHYKVYGHGPLSLLEVTPLSAKYFGDYTCRAENIYGLAEHKIELILAREPTEIQQAVLDKVTSTTLHYRFVPPVNTGGLPLDAYAVEYKETRHQWDSARRRVWPVAENGEYILENLSPMTTYDLRFGCKNRVGFSLWASPQQVTMSVRAKPEAPLLNYGNYLGHLGEAGILKWDTAEAYHLSWQLPEDNGVPIDHFRLRYFPVRHNFTNSATWMRTGEMIEEMISQITTTHPIKFPFTNTFIQMELEAHNELGYSQPSVLVIRGVTGTIEGSDQQHTTLGLSLNKYIIQIVIGSLVLVLLLLILLIDISCYKINKIGVTNSLCEKMKSFRKFDAQSESAKLTGQSLTSTNTLQGFGNGQNLSDGGRGEDPGPGLATITRRRGKEVAGDGRYSVHGLLQEEQENQQLLQCNIYDATPDHSILKHGLAKSLSNFHIAGDQDSEAAQVLMTATPHVLATRRSQHKLPRHIQRIKTQAERRNQKSNFERSLPALNRDLQTELVLPLGPESFSESSETESQQDSNGMDFVGFKKTRDFGDFVTFSNSPSQV